MMSFNLKALLIAGLALASIQSVELSARAARSESPVAVSSSKAESFGELAPMVVDASLIHRAKMMQTSQDHLAELINQTKETLDSYTTYAEALTNQRQLLVSGLHNKKFDAIATAVVRQEVAVYNHQIAAIRAGLNRLEANLNILRAEYENVRKVTAVKHQDNAARYVNDTNSK